MSTPENAGEIETLSLSQRAPDEPIPTRTWHMQISYLIGRIEYTNHLAQENPCIRSQQGSKSITNAFSLTFGSRQLPDVVGPQFPAGVSRDHTYETQSFPYPSEFRKLVETQKPAEQQHQTRVTPTTRSTFSAREQSVGVELGSTPIFDVISFDFKYIRNIQFKKIDQPAYVVIGIFSSGNPNPDEQVVFVTNPKRLFRQLRRGVFRLRGLRGTLLSLRHVKGFRLYKCDRRTGTHTRIHLDNNGIVDLQLLMRAYNRWFVRHHDALSWTKWIHETLNKNSLNVPDGEIALEIVLDWSVRRIWTVVLIPVLLSLVIGLWLNSKDWSDLATIQTAWGTASYIVTSGALLVALLGFLDLSNG